MRKVVLCDMISLDGCYEGPGEGWQALDWHRADDAWEAYGIELLRAADALLLGRRTYEGFAEFWSAQTGELARLLNDIPKVVFSTTLERAEWNNSRLVRQNAAEEVARMKAEDGKNLLIFGSADFAATLTRERLIDEYLLGINPVFLGVGRPFFAPGEARLDLELLGTRTFASGIVVLSCAPRKEGV
ncbi:dihydrofolate reductase family protein [Longimicrobium sp.]|uniref:dihydrofolate reductase family protein n=1 Tax=Longimicrobium sp. TaxID=2029185 RepID=UPI003B3AF2AA